VTRYFRLASVRSGLSNLSRLPYAAMTPQKLHVYGQPIDAW